MFIEKYMTKSLRIKIPAGPAWIGSGNPGEGPMRQIYVPGFFMDELAVTNFRFSEFMQDGGYRRHEFWSPEGYSWLKGQDVDRPAFWGDARFNDSEQPVTGISFFEGEAFASWCGGRLPTEIEWEKAARGTDGRTYPWGEEVPSMQMVTFAPDFVPEVRAPSIVEAHRSGASPYGCVQMAGNVYEWTTEFFHFDTPTRRGNEALVERRPSTRRVLKGGPGRPVRRGFVRRPVGLFSRLYATTSSELELFMIVPERSFQCPDLNARSLPSTGSMQNILHRRSIPQRGDSPSVGKSSDRWNYHLMSSLIECRHGSGVGDSIA